MVNEEKVILMTQMQAYENGEGKGHVATASYFRGDYIGLQVLKSIISVTLVMAILLAGSILYDLENFMKNLYQMDLVEYVKGLAKTYVIVVVGYSILTYLIYSVRYAKAKKSLKRYYDSLKSLHALYNKEA